jgi:hypothetical protein
MLPRWSDERIIRAAGFQIKSGEVEQCEIRVIPAKAGTQEHYAVRLRL